MVTAWPSRWQPRAATLQQPCLSYVSTYIKHLNLMPPHWPLCQEHSLVDSIFKRFLPGLAGKESACSAGGSDQSLGREDPLEEEMATHSSILAWRTPCTEEPGEPQFMGSQKGQTWLSTHTSGLAASVSFLHRTIKLDKVFSILSLIETHMKQVWPQTGRQCISGA